MPDDIEDMPMPGRKSEIPPPKVRKQKPIRAVDPVPQVSPQPAPEVEPDHDDGDLVTVLGQPADMWTPDELTYINEREADILLQLGSANKGSARPLVDEVVSCDVQIKRIDRDIAKLRKTEKDLAKLTVSMKPLTAERADYMQRMIQGMKNLGIMPKDYIQNDPAATSLSELHSRYRKELDIRRQRSWPVGTLSPEAKSLCVEIGSIPEKYISPRALDEDTRKELIDKPNSEPPVQ